MRPDRFLWPLCALCSTHDPFYDRSRGRSGCLGALIALGGLVAMAIAAARRPRPLPADARLGRWRSLDAPRSVP